VAIVQHRINQRRIRISRNPATVARSTRRPRVSRMDHLRRMAARAMARP
jgi:hypothetical protein